MLRMKARRKILIVAGIVIGVAILIPVIRHYQLRFAVANYVAELKAKGEPMELAQVIPPPVPLEQNGVPLITNALTNLTAKYLNVDIVQTNPPQAMQMIAPGKALIVWQQPLIIGDRGIAEPSATNTWKALGRELTSVKSDLDSFQSLTNYPILDFKLDYQNLKLPHTGWLKLSAQWLSASAIYDLNQGNPKNACADVRAMLAIVKGETDERPTISQLIRIAIAAIGISVTWEILQNPNVSENDLAQLQPDWQSLKFTVPIEQSMMFERVESLQEFEQIRKSSEKFNKLWGYLYYVPETPVEENMIPRSMLTPSSLFLRNWDEIRWRWFWSYQDELYGLKSYQIVINAARMTETNKSFQVSQSFISTKLTQLNQKQDSINGLRGILSANWLDATLRKAVRMEIAENVVVTAIGLKRYELRHHQLPATLDQLTPDLLQTVPIDCRDGEPLRYRPNADGAFLLYSVGENGVDDGGNPSLEKGMTSSSFNWQNIQTLDWVWPQPATAEEIQKYYKEQANKSK
jgi:hypothetical protein